MTTITTFHKKILSVIVGWTSPPEIAERLGNFWADGTPNYNSLYQYLSALLKEGLLEKRVRNGQARVTEYRRVA